MHNKKKAFTRALLALICIAGIRLFFLVGHLPEVKVDTASEVTLEEPSDDTLEILNKPVKERLEALAGDAGVERMHLREDDPLPVHHEPERVLYHNHPMSPHRPKSFFERKKMSDTASRLQPRGAEEAPVITFLTSTRNPKTLPFLETRKCILQQSMQAFVWVIVNDHSDDVESYNLLLETAAMDSRIQLVNNTGNPGITTARTLALSLVYTPYWAQLDDDDMFELTGYEKCIWLLESNPNLSICSFHEIAFGAKNYTWTHGLHLGVNLRENYFFISQVTRREVLSSGCHYSSLFNGGAEDWDFWLCVVEHGYWGATIPEMLYWYRVNPTSTREQRWPGLHQNFQATKDLVAQRHRNVTKLSLADPMVKKTEINAPIITHLPFSNLLHNPKAKKSVLIVLPWMFMGGADIGFVRVVRQLYLEGYRLTVVCTLYTPPESVHVRPYFMQFTHDVFTLPLFLRLPDYPRFLVYLIKSRGISTVFFSNAAFIYDMLPALREVLPKLTFVDYIHNEDLTWKSGGFPVLSLINQQYIDLTLVCSDYLKQFMIARGADEKKIVRVYLGIAVSEFMPLERTERERIRYLLGITPNMVVISDVARVTEQKRPILAIDALTELAQEEDVSAEIPLKLIMVGDGDLYEKAVEHARASGVEEMVLFTGYGSQNLARLVLGISDIFLLPSRIEGIALAVAEAMAMGLPVISTGEGGMPELLGEGGLSGIMIPSTADIKADTQAYKEQLARLVRDSTLRQEIGRRARERVMDIFDSDKNLQDVSTNLLLAARVHLLSMKDQSVLKQVLAEDEDDFASAESKEIEFKAFLPNVHHAINNALIDNGPISDLHSIQMRLIDETQWPYAHYALRRLCEEKTIADKIWLDAVATGAECEGQIIDASMLLQSVLHGQCFQWCIFDISTPKYRGWTFGGSCFLNFEEDDINCATNHADLKPKF